VQCVEYVPYTSALTLHIRTRTRTRINLTNDLPRYMHADLSIHLRVPIKIHACGPQHTSTRAFIYHTPCTVLHTINNIYVLHTSVPQTHTLPLRILFYTTHTHTSTPQTHTLPPHILFYPHTHTHTSTPQTICSYTRMRTSALHMLLYTPPIHTHTHLDRKRNSCTTLNYT